MFAALIENSQYFNSRINLCIMLAPVARVDRMKAKPLQIAKNFRTSAALIQEMGNEIFPRPVVENAIMSGLTWATSDADLVIRIGADERPDYLS